MYQYKAKIEKAVDGDTIDVVIDLGFKITTFQRIRMARINTPETYNVKKGLQFTLNINQFNFYYRCR